MEVEADVLASEAHGDRRDRRDPVVTVAVPDDRGLAAGSPGAADVRDQQEPAFVQEGQVRPQPLGFFLMAIQRYRFPRSIASSSRSTARRSGFWQDQPRAARTRT